MEFNRILPGKFWPCLVVLDLPDQTTTDAGIQDCPPGHPENPVRQIHQELSPIAGNCCSNGWTMVSRATLAGKVGAI